ncbi:MAG: aminoglycoside phosphotransferase [Nitrospirae bacterium]|nr:MAG: aminoglycoside phosphotransferase [Nitrospirota bacterium]
MAPHPVTLIDALLHPSCYPHDVTHIELHETHISWVLLTGPFAYKIKKPVDFGFVDFSTLEKRHHFCEEELRLNRRLAPELYQAVVPICGTMTRPVVEGTGPPLEYAVKMRQFSPDAQLDRVLAQGRLTSAQIDSLARKVAHFHEHIDVAGPETAYGEPDVVFRAITEAIPDVPQAWLTPHIQDELQDLTQWASCMASSFSTMLERRKAQGFVRECHGDLHLGNMALVENRVLVFDCLEFNPLLRWIDVISEVAFLVMDLKARNRQDLASRFLNGYLECTGDYEGVPCLQVYEPYRALVRAKVAALRGKTQGGTQDKAREDCLHYVALAAHLIRRQVPTLFIMQGISGSGKTTVSQLLLEAIGAIRVRSDVERKRLFGLPPGVRPPASLQERLYTPAMTDAVYERLETVANTLLQAGYPVIVDATFLQRRHRHRFRQLAQRLAIPFSILACTAPDTILRERVATRGADASDATIAVVEQQHQVREPFSQDEWPFVTTIPTHEDVAHAIEGFLQARRSSRT